MLMYVNCQHIMPKLCLQINWGIFMFHGHLHHYLSIYLPFVGKFSEDEEKEQLAKEISKDWSAGSSHPDISPAIAAFFFQVSVYVLLKSSERLFLMLWIIICSFRAEYKYIVFN